MNPSNAEPASLRVWPGELSLPIRPDARITAAIGLAALLVALVMQPALPLDAAAGALVRAERSGSATIESLPSGWTLDDPIGNALLVLGRAFGLEVLTTHRIVVALAFGIGVAALAALVRVAGGGSGAALLAAALACAWAPFRAPLLASGALATTAALSLVALRVALRGRPLVTGALLGLALFESPVAAPAVAGPIAAAFWIGGMLPRQLLISTVSVWAGATGLRVLISGGGAASAGATFDTLDRELALATLGGSAEAAILVLILALAVARALGVRRRDEPSELVAAAAVVWSAIAIGLAVLGTWPLVVASAAVAPPLVLLAALAPAAVAQTVRPRAALLGSAARSAGAIAVAGALVATGLGGAPRAEARRVALDRDRLEAGRWLASFAAATETVATSSRLAMLGTGRLDARGRSELGPVDYAIVSGRLEDERVVPPATPRGFVPLALVDGAYRRHGDLPWVTVFGRAESRAASTGARAFTLLELGQPQRVPGVPAVKAFEWRGADLFTHPSGGVRFLVPSGNRPFSIRFRPAFSREVPRDRTDGVLFELRAGGISRFRHYLFATDPEPEITLRVVDLAAGEEATIDLLVGIGPRGDAAYDWAMWRDFRVIVEGSRHGSEGAPSLMIDELAPLAVPGADELRKNEEVEVFQ
jgi:hypothetical protein